jgi:hypothetical protein
MQHRREELDPIDDARSRSAEVRIAVNGERTAVADRAQRSPCRVCGERRGLPHRSLGVESAWHEDDDVRIRHGHVGERQLV